MSYQEEVDLESTYLMGTYGRKPVDLVRGEGMTVYGDDGRAYTDFLSGIGVCSLGHCHPAVVEAIRTQAETLIHVSNYYYIEGRGELGKRLSDMLNTCVPEDQRTPWRTFFGNSGAEANELAIKLARRAVRVAHEQAGGTAETAPRKIVTLERSFHGRTLATLAATAQPVKQEAFAPLPDGFLTTPANDVAALEALFAAHAGEICAVMVECIQGESGVHPCTAEFLQAARRLCDEAGALIICDEVQCGIYRAGTYPYAFQLLGFTPDIVTMAKGIASGFPMGACAARDAMASVLVPGDHGSTFGGSCLAVAAANATLSTLADLNIGAHVEEVGAYFRQRLAQLPHVAEVRGSGLMVGIDLTDEAPSAPDVVMAALDAGFLLNYTGPRTMRFLPPLICERSHIDALIETLGTLL